MQAIDYMVELGTRLKTSPVFNDRVSTAGIKNPWFVTEFVEEAVTAITTKMLQRNLLESWLKNYTLKPVNKTIGLIFAGNIPLVGFHDFLCCYIAGCHIKVKLSSKDDELFPTLLQVLAKIDKNLHGRVEVVDKLSNYDAVIATGSDNTNRYFEYYFRNHPKILRKNRNSIGILNGTETPEELQSLADDIFMYFGFGCRNVSKLYVPVGYNFEGLFPQFSKYAWLHSHSKYMNNYDYNRTVLLLNKAPHLANEFVMLVENPSIPSAIGTVHYEYWHDEHVLNTHLKHESDKIQCAVSSQPGRWQLPASLHFGQSQQPGLADYADNVDVMAFLLNL